MSIFGAVNARYAVVLQRLDFRRNNYPAAAAKDLYMRAASAFEQVHHVFEILHMAALVGTDRNALYIFLKRSGYHLFDAAVVPEVNHFSAHALQDTAHDVDGGIVPIKQAGCRHKADFVSGPVIG